MRLYELKVDPLDKQLTQRNISNLMNLIQNNMEGDHRAASLAKQIQKKWKSQDIITNKLSDLSPELDELGQLTKKGIDFNNI